MQRAEMIRFIQGMIATMDPQPMTYSQKATRLLKHMEALGMRPPKTEIIDPILSEPITVETWEE